MTLRSILVVCEGNICRSPMAQALFSHARPALRTRSAGLGALVGMPADEAAVRLMQARGIDIAPHRAQQISRPLCLEAELVLVMDLHQRERLQQLYPETAGRVYRLCEASRKDVPDPYRQPEQSFRQSLALIDEGVQQWLQRIDKL